MTLQLLHSPYKWGKFNFLFYQCIKLADNRLADFEKISCTHWCAGLNGRYVAAAGTCNGDSGGPIYIQEAPGKYIVTGNNFIQLGQLLLYNMHCNENSFYVFLFWEFARPQSQFPHSCVCERFIYSPDRSTYFLQQNRQIDCGNL